MEFFIKLMKWIGYIVAIPVGVYGLFLSIGAGPDGPHKSLVGHIAGLLLVAFTIISFVPHNRLIKSAKAALGAGVILGLPILLVLGLIVYGTATVGIASVFESGGGVVFLVYVALLLPAPLSFVMAWLANQALQRTSR